MNIAHIIFSMNVGGSESLLVDIINEQVKTNNVTIIIVNKSNKNSLIEGIDKRVNVISLNRKAGSKSPLSIIKLNYILYKKNPDIIHIHSYSLPKIIFGYFKKRIVYTVHSLNTPMNFSHKVKCLIAISDAVYKDVSSRSETPIVTIPNGINTDAIKKKEINAKVSAKDTFRIIQLGRLILKDKGQDILINAISILNEKGIKNIEVDFIGAGSDEEELKKLVQEKKLEKTIRFLGLKDRNYIYSHLKEYDLMCHPARYEGFGLVIAEAIAAGVPVLVPSTGGPYEIIEKGKYGFSFKPEDSNECAKSIEYIMNNYTEAEDIAKKAYYHIIENYSIIKMVKEYLKIYKGIVNN